VRQKRCRLLSSRVSKQAERTLERNNNPANAGAISRQDTRATAAVTTPRSCRPPMRSAQADVRSNIAGVQQPKQNPTGTNTGLRPAGELYYRKRDWELPLERNNWFSISME